MSLSGEGGEIGGALKGQTMGHGVKLKGGLSTYGVWGKKEPLISYVIHSMIFTYWTMGERVFKLRFDY